MTLPLGVASSQNLNPMVKFGMSEEPEGNGLIIGGVVLVAVGFLCVGLVVLGFLFFGSSARPAHPPKKPTHPTVALIVDFDLTDPNQAMIEKANSPRRIWIK